MKVAILTLPFHFNYGGFLQAYALTNKLKEWNVESVFLEESKGNIRNRIKKSIYSFFWGNSFIKKNLSILRYTHLDEQFLLTHGIDVIIVGSDQVWRVDSIESVKKYFLDFPVKRIRKIAYAASFGKNDLSISKCEVALCSKLIKDFAHISVREDSGVDICRQQLGIDANITLDPTLLLDTNYYIKLFQHESHSNKRISKLVFSYLLDSENQDALQIINQLKDEKIRTIYKSATVERQIYRRYFCPNMPVSEWLEAIYNADIFVTDSFHGCVFAILFHTPFIVLENKRGGIARIIHLLKMLQIEQCMYTNKHTKKIFIPDIDWKKVDALLQEQRKKSVEYLYKALN